MHDCVELPDLPHQNTEEDTSARKGWVVLISRTDSRAGWYGKGSDSADDRIYDGRSGLLSVAIGEATMVYLKADQATVKLSASSHRLRPKNYHLQHLKYSVTIHT